MSDTCRPVYSVEANGATIGTKEANATLVSTPEVPLQVTLSSYEPPCCQILSDWFFDGSVIMGGTRTLG